MTLLQLCEPLFQYLCQLNHSARRGATFDFMLVRKEVDDLLADVKSRAAGDPAAAGMYDERMELSVVFFVDHLIATSPALPFANEWGDNRIAYERSPAVMTGDSDFFTYFDQALAERGEAADQRLALFYTMVGLGMTGEYAAEPETLRRKMIKASGRLAPIMDLQRTALLCPDALEHTKTANLIEPEVRAPVLIALALAGLLAMLVVSFFVLYRDALTQLNTNLTEIKRKSEQILADDGAAAGARPGGASSAAAAAAGDPPAAR